MEDAGEGREIDCQVESSDSFLRVLRAMEDVGKIQVCYVPVVTNAIKITHVIQGLKVHLSRDGPGPKI